MIRENLAHAISKTAEYKLSQMLKSIPVSNDIAKAPGPQVPKPGKSMTPVTPTKLKSNTPSSYGSIDLMAPSVSAGGVSKTPGAAYTDSLSMA